MTAQTMNYFEPFSLEFERDGTEDIAVIRSLDGEEIVSSLPFWLPEEGDPIPPMLSAVRIMAVAPRLLTTLIECVRLLAETADENGEHAQVYQEAMAVITEAIGRNA